MNGIDVLGPQISVLLAAGVVIIADALFPAQRRVLPFLALAGLVVAALWTTSWVGRGDYQTVFHGTIALDRYAVFFQYVFAGVTATVALASIDWVSREGRRQGEYYALLLTVCAGLMFLAGARDLITIFIALELSSIPQYILAGWGKADLMKNGEPFYRDYSAHFMVMERSRDPETHQVRYPMKRELPGGETDPAGMEIDLWVRSKEQNQQNFPPFETFVHLCWEEVSWR